MTRYTIKRNLTRFKCVVCGKITAGRMPRDGHGSPGDGTFLYPRRHKGKDGNPCAGNIEEAEWVDVLTKMSTNSKTKIYNFLQDEQARKQEG
jgi:hypothetical protein